MSLFIKTIFTFALKCNSLLSNIQGQAPGFQTKTGSVRPRQTNQTTERRPFRSESHQLPAQLTQLHRGASMAVDDFPHPALAYDTDKHISSHSSSSIRQ